MPEPGRPRVVVGDRVIVEDPPTGVAMHDKGLVIAVREDGRVVVRFERDVVMDPYDLSRLDN